MTGTATRTARGTRDACPVQGCHNTVAPHQQMCGRHWRLVPRELQQALTRAWARGAGAGTDLHRDAMAAAVQAAEGDS